MSFEDARDVITTFFKSSFKQDDNSEWMPIEYPNHPVEQGEGDERRAWGRFSINNGLPIGRDVNGGVTRYAGEIALQMFLPEDTGIRLAMRAGDQIGEVMRNTQHHLPNNGIVRMREFSLRPLGQDETGWYNVLMTVAFDRDENRPAVTTGRDYAYVPPTP